MVGDFVLWDSALMFQPSMNGSDTQNIFFIQHIRSGTDAKYGDDIERRIGHLLVDTNTISHSRIDGHIVGQSI